MSTPKAPLKQGTILITGKHLVQRMSTRPKDGRKQILNHQKNSVMNVEVNNLLGSAL